MFLRTVSSSRGWRLSSVFFAALIAAAQTLPERIDPLLVQSPASARTEWGIVVRNLRTNTTVYQHNADHLLAPASNTKLFTTALALLKLGPDYRFVTTVQTEPTGDLRLIGSGDPTLSCRTYPYTADDDPDTSATVPAIEDLADQLVAKGIRHVTGNVIGDDTAYPWSPYAPGWTQEDALFGYGAPVSALTVHDNEATLRIVPGPHAQVTWTPALAPFAVQNYLRADAQSHIDVARIPGAYDLELWGTLSKQSSAFNGAFAIPDPALYAAGLLRDALIRRGIPVDGAATAAHRYSHDESTPPVHPGTQVARRVSPPLSQILQVIDKVSQNLHAELMLRELGRATRGVATRKSGIAAEKDFLKALGIPAEDVLLEDGSGLSRQDLVTPAAIVQVLAYVNASPYRDAFEGFLPIGGVDGTLKERFKNEPLGARIHAKTGSLSHASALSGYAVATSGERYAFSIVANNYPTSSAEIRRVIDAIALAVVDDPGTSVQ